jgi:hypothetical protein
MASRADELRGKASVIVEGQSLWQPRWIEFQDAERIILELEALIGKLELAANELAKRELTEHKTSLGPILEQWRACDNAQRLIRELKASLDVENKRTDDG